MGGGAVRSPTRLAGLGGRSPGRPERPPTVAYRGTALMLIDCTALAYQGAVLSDTVRVAGLAFLRFLDWAWRPAVFDLLTTPTLSIAPAPRFWVFSGASQTLFDTARSRKGRPRMHSSSA